MIKIRRLETIEIVASTEEEVQEMIGNYLNNGYEIEQELTLSDDKNEDCPYFAYVKKDEFSK